MLNNNIKIQEGFVMKRVVSVVIVLMMILIALAGCGGGGKDDVASEDQFVGNWNLTSVDKFGTGTESLAQDIDMSGSLDIKSDGTIEIDIDGEIASDNWKLEDGKLVLDSGLVVEMKKGRVALKIEKATYFFAK